MINLGESSNKLKFPDIDNGRFIHIFPKKAFHTLNVKYFR